MQTQDAPELLTPAEAARYLRISLTSVYRLLRRHQLPAEKVGQQWRIRRSALVAGAQLQDRG